MRVQVGIGFRILGAICALFIGTLMVATVWASVQPEMAPQFAILASFILKAVLVVFGAVVTFELGRIAITGKA